MRFCVERLLRADALDDRNDALIRLLGCGGRVTSGPAEDFFGSVTCSTLPLGGICDLRASCRCFIDSSCFRSSSAFRGSFEPSGICWVRERIQAVDGGEWSWNLWKQLESATWRDDVLVITRKS